MWFWIHFPYHGLPVDFLQISCRFPGPWPLSSLFFLRICAFANNQYAIEHALGDFRLRSGPSLNWWGMGQNLWIYHIGGEINIQ